MKQEIKIHFYKGTHFISRLIQLRTFSPYSHVSIQIGEYLYEAKEGEGVILSIADKTPPKSLDHTVTYKVQADVLENAHKWLNKQVGKKYDYLALFLFLGFPRPYKVDDRWFCSELGAMFLYKVGIIEKPKILLSPGSLFLYIP